MGLACAHRLKQSILHGTVYNAEMERKFKCMILLAHLTNDQPISLFHVHEQRMNSY